MNNILCPECGESLTKHQVDMLKERFHGDEFGAECPKCKRVSPLFMYAESIEWIVCKYKNYDAKTGMYSSSAQCIYKGSKEEIIEITKELEKQGYKTTFYPNQYHPR